MALQLLPAAVVYWLVTVLYLASAWLAAGLAAWDFLIVLHLIVEHTVRQATVPGDQLGRISAVTRFVSWGADPVGAVMGGLLVTTALGTFGTLLVCLAGFLLAGLVLLASTGIRTLDIEL